MKDWFVIKEHSKTTQALAGAHDTEAEAKAQKDGLTRLGIVAVIAKRTDRETVNHDDRPSQ